MGDCAEDVAVLFFQRRGWKMTRTQPPTKIIGMVKYNGRMWPMVIHCKKGGVADFTGGRPVMVAGCKLDAYTGCEVKHHTTDDKMPASTLNKDQRDWMIENVAPSGRYVFILWGDGTGELHHFIEKGSYKKGDGAIR